MFVDRIHTILLYRMVVRFRYGKVVGKTRGKYLERFSVGIHRDSPSPEHIFSPLVNQSLLSHELPPPGPQAIPGEVHPHQH